MMLYVNGRDIAQVTLGLLNDERSVFVIGPVTVQASPEQFLAAIDTFLAMHAPASPLTGIVAVLGPGSATALRTSLTLVNTLVFARNIPIFGVELELNSDDRSVLVALRGKHAIPMARPTYAHEARITTSTKDALGRK